MAAATDDHEGRPSGVFRGCDDGGKGKALETDVENQCKLGDEQVASLLKQTELLQAANRTLKRWMLIIVVVSITLGVSQIAIAITAARLSKDTEVDSSSGLLMVKGHNEAVVVLSRGRTTVLQVDETNSHRACIRISELSNLWAATASGSNTNAILRSSGSAVSVSFTAMGSMYNETHACLKTTEGTDFCTAYSRCNEQEPSNEGGRRLAEDRRHQRKLMFHQNVQRRLYDLGMGSGGGGGGSRDDGGYGGSMNPGACDDELEHDGPCEPDDDDLIYLDL